jgi:hypothetical protein
VRRVQLGQLAHGCLVAGADVWAGEQPRLRRHHLQHVAAGVQQVHQGDQALRDLGGAQLQHAGVLGHHCGAGADGRG